MEPSIRYGIRIRWGDGCLSLDDGNGNFTTQGMHGKRIEEIHKAAAASYSLPEAMSRADHLFDWLLNECKEPSAEVQICARPSWRVYRRMKRSNVQVAVRQGN